MTDNPFDLLDAEAARLDRFFATLTDADWRVESRCSGWNRKDMLAHLIGIEDYIRAGLDDTVAQYSGQAGPGIGYEGLNEFLVAKRADTAAEELLADWRAQVSELHPRLRERGADAVIATQAGPYPLGRQTFFFATELAIHADDVFVPIPQAERSDRLEWRLAFGLDALAEYGKGVTVRSEGDYHKVALGQDSADLSSKELVEATSGRLSDDRLPAELRKALVVLA